MNVSLLLEFNALLFHSEAELKRQQAREAGRLNCFVGSWNGNRLEQPTFLISSHLVSPYRSRMLSPSQRMSPSHSSIPHSELRILFSLFSFFLESRFIAPHSMIPSKDEE
jgi:hypothetical protein